MIYDLHCGQDMRQKNAVSTDHSEKWDINTVKEQSEPSNTSSLVNPVYVLIPGQYEYPRNRMWP